MKPKDVVKWKPLDWTRRVKYMMPSSGGAVGVVFVWADKDPRQYIIHPYEPPHVSSSQFVIKPTEGSAAPVKFAEHVLRKVAGAVSPHTRAIKQSPQHGSNNTIFQHIHNIIESFKNNERIQSVKERWSEVWPYYDKADCYMIQETQVAIKDFGAALKSDTALSRMLADETLMTNLGKLFVADAMIGNGDRLYKMNMGNVIFQADGRFCAIDSATILTNYQAMLNDASRASHLLSVEGQEVREQNPGSWVIGITNPGNLGNTPLAIPKPNQHIDAVPVSFAVEKAFDPAAWYDNEFRRVLEFALHVRKLPKPSHEEWERGKQAFLRGVDAGMREVDKRLSGLNWMMVKLRYKRYVSKYGGDPNLDWTNFEIRRMYFKLRRKGLSCEQAMERVANYAWKKLPRRR